jgi:protocatechuate 3,4-dioxygenase beta subunit
MATIEGVVVNETTKEPLRRVEISLYRSGKNGGMPDGGDSVYSAVTDATGKFRIENVEAADYFLDCRKTGFAGSRAAFGSSARTLKLGAGESLTDLRYSLLPQAIVSGRVVDDEGEPVQGVTVLLARSHYRRGSARMLPGGQAQTNDRGEYRIVNVLPGKYYIQASIQRMMMGGGAPPVPSETAGAPRTAFVSTYYPSATEMAQATRIEAQAGLERSGQDITLRKEKVVKVSGKVLDADGAPAKQTFVSLAVTEGLMRYSGVGSAVDEKGIFTLNNVRPGQYTVMAYNLLDSQSNQAAQTPLTVGDCDVTNVALQLLPGLEAKGLIVLEGSDRKDFDFSSFFLGVEAADSSPFGGSGTEAKSDGTFTIPQISPGRYTLSVHPDAGEGYVQSIQVGGEDVFGKEVDGAALASGGLRVVVRLDSAKVTGTVEIPEDRKANLRSPTIVFVPAGPRLRSASQFSIAPLDQTNSFELKNLRPGDYLAFAFEEYDYTSLDDPEVLAALESMAAKVSLARGESKALTLKLVPWPEQFADRLQ